jgi:hypothetical protein
VYVSLQSWSACDDDSEPTVFVPSMLVTTFPSPPPVGLLLGLLLELLLELPPVAELLPPLELPALGEPPPVEEPPPAAELPLVRELPPEPAPPPEPLVPPLLQATLAIVKARPTAFTSAFGFVYMGHAPVSAARAGSVCKDLCSRVAGLSIADPHDAAPAAVVARVVGNRDHRGLTVMKCVTIDLGALIFRAQPSDVWSICAVPNSAEAASG